MMQSNFQRMVGTKPEGFSGGELCFGVEAFDDAAAGCAPD
jgi:hypothetical protein